MANETKFLDYSGLSEYNNLITGKIFIPTIDFIPNETTLTYISNGKTFNYDIGDFVRVIDNTKDVGYKFYQLYNITEQGEAVWGAYAEKAAPTYIAPTARDLVYDGTPQELLNPGSTSEGVFQYSLLANNGRSVSDSFTWSISVPTATEADNYIVYWRLVGDSSHADIQPTAIHITIDKVTPTYTSPIANTLTYNEHFQELITPGQTNFGTFQYCLDGTSWSTEIPTRLNAGTYTVYYRILGDDNINTTNAETVSVIISPKQITSPTITLSQDVYTYDEQEHKPIPTLHDGQTLIPTTEYTVSYQNNINAGTAQVIITDNPNGDYAVSGTKTFTINKATGRVDVLPTNKAVTYNAESQVLANAGSGTGVMYYSLEEDGNFSTTIPSRTNAGNYTLYFYAAESANYLQSATQNIPVTISKANPSFTAPQGKTGLIYSSLAQDLLIAGSTPDGTMKYSEDNGETWTTTVPQGTDAISYHPQWKIFGDSNHNDTTPEIIDVTIAKVTPTVTAPTLVENLVYNSTSQALLNAGSTNFGTLQYSRNNETFSTAIPTEINAGSYDVWYRVLGDSNINDVAAVKLTNTISKATAAYTAPTSVNDLVYNGLSQALLNEGSTPDGTMQYSSDNNAWSTEVPTAINAGTYTSYWRIIGDSNHNDKASASISTTIDKAAGEMSAPVAIGGLVYNGNTQSLINAGSGTGTMQYKVDSGSWSNNIPTMDNAGTYTIYYRVLESANYYGTDGTDNITNSIAKVTPTVVAPTPRVLTYNTSSQALVNAGSTNWGTLQYSLDNSSWSTNIPEAINYGSYTVYYRVVGNSNINDVASASVACSIAEKRVSTPTIELDPTEYTYNGKTCEPSVVVKDGTHVIPTSEYTVTYSNNINAGTATVTITDNTAGNYDITGTKDFTINKAAGSVTTKPTAKTLTYNGNAQALVNAGSGTGTIYYRVGTSGSFTTTVPTATAAGSYTVYFYAAESSNYLQSTPTESVSVTIGEKTIVIPSPTGYSAQYDGNAHTATFGSTEGASITKYRYSTNNSTWTESTTNPSLTNVGTLYTQAYYSALTNYTGSGWSASATIAISRQTTATASAVTGLIYNGTTESNGTAQTGVSGAHITWTGTTSATNADSYTAYATPESNYAWSDGTYAQKTISWSIARRGQTAPVLNGAETTYPTTASASVKTAGTVANGTATAPGTLTWSNQSRSTAGSQTATAYYAATTTNFSASPTSAGVTVKVNQATGTATITGRTVNYNGEAQNMLTVSGNTGTMHYRVGTSGSWTTTIPTRINAGSDTIYYYMDASTNYTARGSSSSPWGSVTGTVNKINPTITNPTAKSGLIYNGSEQTLWNSGSNTTPGSFSYGKGLNANTYSSSWSFTPTDATNYNSLSGSANITIAKVTPTINPKPTAKTNLVYSGSAQVLANAGTTNWGTLKYSLDNSTYSTTIPTGTNATTYTVYYRVDGDSNINDVAAASFNVTIAKADPTYTAPTANNQPFNNSAQSLLNAGSTSHGTIKYSSNNSSWSTTIPTGTNAGTYTSYWKLEGDSNHNSVNSTSIQTTISKINLSVTEVNYNAAYDGNSHSSTVKVNSGGWNGKTIVYGASTSYGNTATSSGVTGTAYALHTATNYTASTTVYYKITGGTNHNDYTDSVTFAISKKSTNAPVLTAGGTTTYTGTTYYATAKNGNGNPAGTIYYGASSGSTSYSLTASSTAANMSSMGRANVGTTTIYAFFRPTDTTNYSDSAGATTTVTISNKATGYLTATTTNRTYNGSAQTIATIATNSGDYYFGLGSSTTSAPSSWGSKNTALSATAAGTYYVWAKCDTSTNYNAVAAKYMATVTISQRTVTITAPTKTNRTYTGSAQTIFAAGSCTTGGTMYYSDTNKTFSTSTWTTTLPYTQKTNAGTYTIYYYCYVSDTANNKGTNINTILSVSATINKGTRSGAVSCNNVTYGSTVTASVSVNPTSWTGGAVTWGITNGTGTATINSSGVVTPTKVGTVTVTASVAASGNYAAYTATSKQITISQRTVTPTAPTATNRNYSGSAQTIFSGGSCTAGGTMYYSDTNKTFSTSTWSTSLPYTQKTDAGTYTIYWYCYVSDTTNNTGTNINTIKSVSATINKVAATLPGTISGDRVDKDHTPARATVSKDYTGGTLQYSTDNGSNWANVTWYSGNLTANPSTSTVGDTSVLFRVNPDGNHTVVTTSSAITLTVVKATDATVTISLSNTLTYTGSAQTIATASGAHGLSNYYIGYKKDSQATADSQVTWNSANTTPLQATNAGDYYVYYKYTVDSSHSGDKAYTYVGKVTINKKSRSGAVSCNNVTYGSTVTASVSGNTETGTITWGITAGTGTATISGGVVTPTKVGKVTVTASVAATANYAAYTATSKEITISQRTVTWSAPTRTNRTYNGSNQTIFAVGSSTAGGTMKYSSDNSTWSTSLPYTQKKEPGTYTIYYKCEVSDTTNNTGTNINTSYSLSATISKISTNAPVLTAGTKATYDGNYVYATAKNGSGNPEGKIYYGASSGSTSYNITASSTAANLGSMGRRDVGTTTIYAFFRPTDTTHYSDSAGATTTASVTNKATGSSGSVSNPAAQTYKASGTYSYQLGISGATGTVTYPTSITVKNSGGTTISGWSCTAAGVVTVPAATTAGAYTVTGNITVATSTNYNAVSATSKTWTVTINKANQSAPTATGATVAYHNTATASASGGGGFGTLTWTNGNSRTAVGSQSTAAYWSGDANHNASPNSNSVTLQVNKATDQSVTVTLTNRNYTGSAQVVASATSHGCKYYLGFGSSSTSAATSWFNSSISKKDAGTYYIWYEGTADGNHSADIAATYKGTVKINKIDPTYVAPTAKTGLSYTGSAQTLYNTGTNTTAGSFSYSGGSQTNAGTYTVSWTFTPTDTTNYNTKSGSFQVTIARAKSASASASNKTYNGTTESNGTSQTGVTGSNVDWTGNTSGTNAGSYTAYATPKTNYAWSDGTYAQKTITWTMSRRGQTAPVLNASTATYPNTASASVKTAGTVSGGTTAAPGTLTWTNQSRSTVGSQTATAYYAATTTNFSASSASTGVTVQVNKYTPIVTLSATNRKYNGNALYASATVSVPSGGKTMKGTIYYGTSSGATTYSVTYSGSAVNLSSVSITNVGSTTVYAYFAPDSTCNDVYNSSGNVNKTMTISKADQSAPTATGATVGYGNTATASASSGGHGSIEWYNNVSTRTTVGTTTGVKARWSGNSNYNASDWSNSVSLVVEAKWYNGTTWLGTLTWPSA